MSVSLTVDSYSGQLVSGFVLKRESGASVSSRLTLLTVSYLVSCPSCPSV